MTGNGSFFVKIDTPANILVEELQKVYRFFNKNLVNTFSYLGKIKVKIRKVGWFGPGKNFFHPVYRLVTVVICFICLPSDEFLAGTIHYLCLQQTAQTDNST